MVEKHAEHVHENMEVGHAEKTDSRNLFIS